MMRDISFRIFVLLAVLLLGGCAQNTVPLIYSPAGSEVFPTSGAPTICVVTFEDARSTKAIGIRSDSSQFEAASSIQDWATRSLAAELTRQGLIVTLAPSEQAALQGSAEYILTGTIEEVWLTEHSSASYDCRMRMGVELKRRGKGRMLANVFNSSLSRRVVPMSDVPRNLLAETMGDLVRPMALAVMKKITP